MEKTTETEMKLKIARKDLKKLLTLDFVKKAIVTDSYATKNLINTYYDTASSIFTKNGIAYRIRECGGKFEATIKTEKINAGGLSSRNEFNLPITKDVPPLTGFETLGYTGNLQELVGNEKLQAMFKTIVTWQVYLLKITKSSTVEMAFDLGDIVASDKKDKIAEVELEIKLGNLQDLLDFVVKIAAKIPIFIEHRSKFARGLILRGNPYEEDDKIKINSRGMIKDEISKLLFYYCDSLLRKQNDILAKTETDRKSVV